MPCGIEWRPLRPSRCAPLLSKCKWGMAGQQWQASGPVGAILQGGWSAAVPVSWQPLAHWLSSFAVPWQAGPTVAALLAEHPADVLRTLQKSGVQKVAEFQVEVR